MKDADDSVLGIGSNEYLGGIMRPYILFHIFSLISVHK